VHTPDILGGKLAFKTRLAFNPVQVQPAESPAMSEASCIPPAEPCTKPCVSKQFYVTSLVQDPDILSCELDFKTKQACNPVQVEPTESPGMSGGKPHNSGPALYQTRRIHAIIKPIHLLYVTYLVQTPDDLCSKLDFKIE